MTPNLTAQNRGFVSVHMAPLLTFSAALLQAAAPGPHPVSSTAQSHIPNQTFTHPRWRLRVTRSSCGSERSFCSQALLSSQADGWWGGIRGQEGDSRVGLESSIQLLDVELPDLHEEKGPDPLKCTIENVLMINQGKNFLSIVQPVFPRKDMSNVSYLCRRVQTCLLLSDCWCTAILIEWNLNKYLGEFVCR